MKNFNLIKANVLLSIVAVCLLMTQAVAQFENYTGAVDPRGTRALAEKPIQDFSYKYLPPSGREGGEDIASAILIPAIPFSDNGLTCDNVDDYDETCPFTSPGSSDVVYSYTPATNGSIDIDLFGSDYDTKVYVYQNGYTPGYPYACNDDYYPNYVSKIIAMPVTAGNTYYIVIDGWYGDCGNYVLTIGMGTDCSACLSCSIPEGEPDIPNNGLDITNGGCNSNPQVFMPLQLNRVLCGRANTYDYFGDSYRDTDWYELTLTEAGTLYWSGIAMYNLQLVILSSDYCDPLYQTTYAIGTAPMCSILTISADLPAGTYYLWAGPSFYSDMPGGANYNAVATLNAPPPDDWCTLPPPFETPVSNWALFMAIGLIGLFVTFRIWRKM
jgi:hypothetical protein